MTHRTKLLALLWLVSCAASPIANAADFASVDQSESYTYTMVRQDGDRTKVKVRQIDPRKFERIRDRLTAKVDRITNRYVDRSGGFRSPGWPFVDPANNSVALDQGGNGNLAVVSQSGTDNTAAVNQSGALNAAYTVQRGSDLHAVTTQSGDHNITFILQRNRRASQIPALGFWGPGYQSTGQPDQ